jgi:TonB-linked SusC/RagA family outer membrane protein
MKTKFNGILTLLLALVVQFTFAQSKTISGTVSDDTGPLPGVSIIIKGTNSGAETDFDGNYSISANTGDVLQFGFIGKESTEKTVGISNTINVTMADDAEALDEIVVTGVAGATSRKKLSVTVNKVSAKDLEYAPTTSAASALQGKVAGVTVTNFGQPGSGATIKLRGATNIFGTQSPLVIVDGVIVEGGLQDINSDDIASFEIVKGASASALYGSRAGNGVIVVTTKKGKIGKIEVTVKNEVAISSINNQIKTNQSHHYDLATDWQSAQGTYTKFAGVSYPADYDNSDYRNVTGGRVVSADNYADNPYGVYYDNQKLFFRQGKSRVLYTSISSATDNSNIFFSAEKNSTEGVLKETDGYERVAARLNTSVKITDWLKFSAYNQFSRSFNRTPGGSNGIFFDLSVTAPDVNLSAPNTDGQPYQYSPNVWESTVSNPLYPLYSNPEQTNNNKFSGSYKLNTRFSDWVNLDLEYAIEAIDSRSTDFVSNKNYIGGGPKEDLYATNSPGSFTKSSYRNTSQKLQATFNFIKEFNDLTVTAKLSGLLENSNFVSDYAVGQIVQFPGRSISLDNYGLQFIGSNESIERALNYFAIVGLDYKDRYILDGMYRIDQSSLFGADERTNDYFRVSGAYRISKDIDIPGVQELKVHGAYGTAGQRPQYEWQYERIPVNNGDLGSVRTRGNSFLKPSKTTELEVGLSGDFLDIFHLEAVYSKAKTEDQFMLVDLFSPRDNYEQEFQNIGTVEFNTIEITLDAKILKDSKLKWDMGIVFEKTNNEITQLDISARTIGPNNGEVFRLEEGLEFGTMFGREFVKSLEQMAQQLPATESIDNYAVNSDGFVVDARTIGTNLEKATIRQNADGSNWVGDIGNSAEDFKLGIRNNLRYKEFNFYMLWDWKQGGDIYNRNGQWLTRDDRHEMVDQVGVPEQSKKTVSYYQSLYDVNQNNKFWVEDGSFVKLREASIFYTLDQEKLKNVANGFFSSLRLGITGTNLLTFTDYSGWDPEVQLYDGDTFQYYAVDFQVYPLSSTYTLSATLKF